MRLFLIALISIVILPLAVAQSVNLASVPAWVKPVSFSQIPLAKDSIINSGGYYDLLANDQYNLAEQQAYFHYAQIITSTKGLENISAITYSYDPEYQTLTFHILRIIRDGKIINQLKREKIELLRREENLERAVYDGSITAVFNFENVQVGDVIETAVSYKGVNPIFENKFSRSLYFNYGVPIEKIYTRIVAEKHRTFYLKKFNQAPDVREYVVGNRKEYEWELTKVKALSYDEGRPGWYEPANRVDFSEYQSWQEVAAWGNRVFTKAYATSPAIEEQLKSLKKKDLEESVNACIRFVQDDIRYLSFSEGIHGYQPHLSAKIYEQRFGDCKDKSVLLSLMLNKLGVNSAPALVHSSNGKLVNESLPSPRLFNHCIVQFVLNDSVYWIDPTMSLERGPLKKRFTPEYAYGLVLNPASKNLTEIPYDAHQSGIAITETFDVGPVGTSSALAVDVKYTGDEANTIRHYFLSTSRDEVTKSYLNFYANDYPDIELVRDVAFEDNEEQNVFTTHERYNITQFWNYDSIEGKHQVSVYPRTLAGYFGKPSTKIRTMPYALTFPRQVEQKIILQMPEAWNIKDSFKKVESAGFAYASESVYRDTLISLTYEYRSKKSFLEPNEVGEHIKKIDEIQNNLTLNLYSYDNGAPTAINYPFIIILTLACVGFFIGIRQIYAFDPEPKPAIEKHDRIGGWLILPTIGLFVSPLRMMYDLSTAEFFSYNNWRILTDSSFAAYNPSMGVYIVSEMLVNFGMMIYVITLLVIFLKRRSSAPVLIVVFYIGNVSLIFLDSIVAQSFGIDGFGDENLKEIARGTVGAAIWVPYFLISNRVKGTFTMRHSRYGSL